MPKQIFPRFYSFHSSCERKKIKPFSVSAGRLADNIEHLIEKIPTADDTVCYRCTECQKVMKRKDHMKNHVKTHFVGQEVNCYICGKPYKNIRSMEVHISSYHNNPSS